MSNQLQTIRDYASSLEEDERKSFIDKFNSIKDDDNKISTLVNRISDISKPEVKESIPQMLGRNAKSAYNESLGAITSSVNDLSFNNIKPNIARLLGKDTANNIFPEQATLEGKATRFSALPGASLKALGLVRGGAIMGAGMGGANDLLNKDTTLQDRGVNAVIGGAAGASIGALAKGVINITPKVIDKSKQIWTAITDAVEMNKRLPSVKSLTDATNRIENQKDILRTSKELLSNVTSLENRNIQSKINKITDATKEDVSNVAIQIGKESKKQAAILKSTIGKKVPIAQEAVPEFFGKAGKAYGQTLDHIIETVDEPILSNGILKKNAAVATNEELHTALKNVLSQGAGDPLIENSLPYSKIKALAEKYNPESITKSNLVDTTGNPIIKDIGGDAVSLKELLAEMRDMNASVRAGVKSGSKAISPEDLTVSRFNHSIGELVKDRVPSFKALQESYSPVMKAKELAYKVFKPSKGEFATTSAESFFKRIAFKDKISIQDQALIDILEKGTTVSGTPNGINVEGIGNISSELKSIGNKIASLTEEKSTKQLAINNGKSLNINGLKNQIKMLQDSKNVSNINNTNRLFVLNKRLSVIKDALENRKKIEDIKFKLGVTAAVAAGTGVVGRTVGSMLKSVDQK